MRRADAVLRAGRPPTRAEAPVETRIALPDLVAGLSDATAFGEEGPVEIAQTHASVVFLTSGHAYKVKKPVRLWGLLDYGTFDRRHEACEAEVLLNRRLAPEIYLDVVRIVRRGGRLRIGGAGRTVEHAVKMIRFPANTNLQDRLVAGMGGLEEEIARVAETLAEFHAANRLAPADARTALPSVFGAVLRQNFAGTKPDVPEVFPAAVHRALRAAQAERLADLRTTIRRRVGEGRMVDGHGDVRLEHVLRFHGRVAIVDCIEFDDRLRRIDPLSDLAFLSMDLAAHGRPELAAHVESAYLAKAPDPDAPALLPLYLAYRAHVRAKVDVAAARDELLPADARRLRLLSAKKHLVLAWTYACSGRPPPLVLLRGFSGSGKSVLVDAVSPWFLGTVHRSDVVRKELAGIPPTHRVRGQERDALYSAETSRRTYRALLERAEASIRAGHAAFVDATYLLRGSRLEALRLARELGAPFAIVDVRAPDTLIRERLEHRTREDADPSDADVKVFEAQRDEAEPFAAEEERHVVPYEAGEAPEVLAARLAERLASIPADAKA